MTINDENFTWTKPKPKRTFQFNGVPLPCPVNNDGEQRKTIYRLHIGGKYYDFDNIDDLTKVSDFLHNLLTEARDKP